MPKPMVFLIVRFMISRHYLIVFVIFVVFVDYENDVNYENYGKNSFSYHPGFWFMIALLMDSSVSGMGK